MSQECPKSAPPNRGLVLVDADTPARRQLAQQLTAHGYSVMPTADPQEALAVVKMGEAAFVVTELRWGRSVGFPGLDLIRLLRRPEAAPLKIVVLARLPSVAAVVAAIKAGADDVLEAEAGAPGVVAALKGESQPLEAGPDRPDDVVPTVAFVVRQHLERVLVGSGGCVARAARRLRMHRQSMRRMLSKAPPRA